MKSMDKDLFFNIHKCNFLFDREVANIVTSNKAHQGSQGFLMSVIYEQQMKNNPVYQKDLEKKLGIRKSSITQLLNLLEKDGSIIRVNKSGDLRQKCIILTEEGLKETASIKKQLDEISLKYAKDLSEVELDVFESVITKIIKKLEEN